MNGHMRIFCLVNDVAGPANFPVEHGLSFLLESESGMVLFDTGQTRLVVQNAQQFGFDLTRLAHIVLSHGHYDHTGGLEAVLDVAPHGELFAHSAAFDRKYSRRSGQCCEAGMPALSVEDICRHGWPITTTLSPVEVTPGLHVTGPIPRVTAFEDVGGPFFLDEAGAEPDPLIDDQALYFSSDRGVVVLLGCAHAGVINTLNHIHTLTGGAKVHAVIGGMHLQDATPLRLAATLAALQRYDLDIVAPCHCTGTAAMDLLRTHFVGQWRACGAGSHFDFNLL